MCVSSPNFIIARVMKLESGLAVRLARERHVGRVRQCEVVASTITCNVRPFSSKPFPSYYAELNLDSGGNEPRSMYRLDILTFVICQYWAGALNNE